MTAPESGTPMTNRLVFLDSQFVGGIHSRTVYNDLAELSRKFERALHPILVRLSAIHREGGTPFVLTAEEVAGLVKLREGR